MSLPQFSSRSRRRRTLSTATWPADGPSRPRSAPSSTRPPTSCSFPGRSIALVYVDRASVWVAIIIIGRELLILGLRGVVAAEGTVFAPSIWGKLKTNVQFVAILLAILRYDEPLGPLLLDEWAMLVAAAITVLSAVEYLARSASALSEGSS